MKTVAVVAWREIVEHKTFVAAALAAVGLSFVVPITSGLFKASPADVREIVMVCMVLGFIPLVALLLGASTVSGTVAAGRFGFFLSRPLSGAAIWMGKLIGVLVVIFVCEAIILAPAVVAGNPGGIVEQMASDLPYDYDSPLPRVAALAGLAMLPVVLVLVAHAVATLWRGRSLWLLLDLVTLLAGATAAWLCLRPLLGNGAAFATAVVALALAAAAFAVLVGAPFVQLRAGGVDPRRQHRVFSVAIAVGVAVLFAGVGGYAAWLTAPSAADVMRHGRSQVEASPDGRWVSVNGDSAGRWDYEAAFLVDLGSSNALRIDAGPRYGLAHVAFSADGDRAAWLGGSSEPHEIRYCDLDEVPARCRDTSVFVSRPTDFELSSDGAHVAVIDDRTLSVSAIPNGDLLGSTLVSSDERAWGPRSSLVVAGHSFRVIGLAWSPSVGAWVTRITEFHIPTRTFRHLDSPEANQSWSAKYDPARDRMLRWQWSSGDRPWRYVDGRTLEDIDWTLARPLDSEVALLADGRLVDLVCEHRSCRLEVLTPEGGLETSFPMPLEDWLRDNPVAEVSFGPLPAQDRLAIRLRRCTGGTRSDPTTCEGRSVLVDLKDGSYGEFDEEAMTLADVGQWGKVDIILPAGSPASRLAWGQGGLVLWDPETGETEVLAARYE